MENLIWLIPALACPLGMLAVMWLMGKGMGHRGEDREPRSMSELRAERDRISAEIERRGGERERDPAGTPGRT